MINHLLKTTKKSWRGLSLLAIASGAIFSSVSGQTTVQIGTETGTSTNVPLTTNYGYNYTQQIYTAADLNNAGVSGLTSITKVYFYLNSGTTSNSFDWTVYLGNSTKTEFSSTSDWEAVGNLTNCFSGMVTFPSSAGGWMEIVLSTPFEWDGVSNIVIAVDENQGNWGTLLSWRKSNLGNNRSIYYRNDSNNPDPTNPPTATGRFNYVPNVQLETMPAPDCSGTPAVANLLSSEGLTLCEGETSILSIDNGPFESGLTYQWQTFDGAAWNDITGATDAVYTTDELTASTNYQVVVGCSNSGMSTASNAAMITVNPNPTVTVDVTETSICSGGSATVNATGATSYAWTPATALDNTTTATVVANPTSATTYTVTGTDGNGCTNTAQVAVLPYESVSADMVIDPIELCESGVPVTATVSGVPANAAGGTWTYRFLEADGTTEAQPWNTTNTFNFIPGADSLYTFYYQLMNSACGTALDSVAFSFAVGFGADVAVIDYDCNNMGGSINLSDVFGQAEIQELYTNDFTAGADLSAATFTGNASVANNRAQLTASATGVSGYMELNIPGFSAGANNSFTVSFDLTADLPINNYGTGGADGMAYSFGDDATPGANGNGMNGKGTKLRLSFDAAGNSGENGNVTGIYLVYGWTAGNAFGPGSAQTLAYSPNLTLWKGKTDVPVTFSIDGQGKASLTVDGVLVFDQVQLPAAYTSADVSTWKHLFSAQTGGDAMRHAITNLEMTSGLMNYGISTGSATDVPTTWQTNGNFTDLAPGTYHVWLAKDTDAICGKNIQTVEIVNTNPVVDLGNDTTICAGETLTLDAGNAGASYTWSNTNAVTQTIEVDEAGSYVAYVTAPNGCLGIGTINVDITDAPSASGIYMQGTYPNMTFTVLNANGADSYDWDFGDGTTATNAPSTVAHWYAVDGTYDVTVTLSNDCGSTDVTEQFNVVNTLSVGENSIDGLTIYPNPTSGAFTVSISSKAAATVSVTTLTGAQVIENRSFAGVVEMDATSWQSGVYFVQVVSEGKTSTHKVVVR